MTKDPFDAALDGFKQWTAATKRKLSADPETAVGEVETLLDLMRDYLDAEGPADLAAGDLRELLLQIYPRKITVFDADDTENTIPAVRDFLAYLAERGEMPESTARALERELDEVAPRFADAMMDPANWGMAGSLVHAMAAEGVDLDDQAAVDRWIGRYNAQLAGDSDDEEDDDFVDLKEAFGLPDQMAPVRLPEPGELAALARRAPLMAQLRKLAWWLGAGRAVTEDEELASDDAAEAAGLGQPHRRHLVGQAEGLLQIDEVVVFLVVTVPRQLRVVAADPAVHSRLVVQVDALGGHRVDQRPGHAPVRRVHHRLGEPRRYLVQLSFQCACRARRHLAAFGEVGEEIADRGDRVLGVVGVEHGHLARVDLQQQFSQVPGTEIE